MSNWDKQVGGTHYKSAYAHWDFVIDAGLGYFEGQATRYVMRYRKPDGGEGEKDLNKAIHYINKLHSVYPRYIGSRAGMYLRTAPWVKKLVAVNQLNILEHAIIQLVAGWSTPEDLLSARKGVEDLLTSWLAGDTPIEPRPVPLTEENKHAERETQAAWPGNQKQD